MSKDVSRRSLLQSAGVAGLSGIVANRAIAEEPKPVERFKTQLGTAKVLSPVVLAPDPLVVNNSPDGLATTILFGSKLDLLIRADVETQSVTKVAVLEIPVTVPDPNEEFFLGYHGHINGTVKKGEGTRVAVSIDLGGTHHSVEYPFGKAYDGPIEPESFFSYSLTEVKQVEGPDGVRTLVVTPTPPHYTAVLVLSIQRRTPQDDASLIVEDLAVEVIRPQKGPQQPQERRTRGRDSKETKKTSKK